MEDTKDQIISTVDVQGSLKLQIFRFEKIFHVNFICFNVPD